MSNKITPKVVVIIQARMGSTRLFGKIMKKICGKTILEHDILRISEAKNIDEIIIATTVAPADIAIKEEAKRLRIKSFCGSENNVLSRYYYAAKENNANIVVRITSDCPLYDATLLDDMLEIFSSLKYDYLSNCIKRTYPRGLDTEIFTFAALEKSYNNATEESQKEHVTPYIYQNLDIFKLQNYISKENNSKFRWTLDTKEDFEFIEAVYNELYQEGKIFNTAEILKLLKEKPELININSHIEQKKVAS
jgi:spore coat polysaccharide biosynthesis protein SpsF